MKYLTCLSEVISWLLLLMGSANAAIIGITDFNPALYILGDELMLRTFYVATALSGACAFSNYFSLRALIQESEPGLVDTDY